MIDMAIGFAAGVAVGVFAAIAWASYRQLDDVWSSPPR
jgi:hypothetical protein